MKSDFENFSSHKGLLVTDEFPLGSPPYEFVELLCQPKNQPTFIFAKWVMAHKQTEGVNFQYAKYDYLDGKQVYLYCFPPAMDRSFDLEDVELPIKNIGFIIIVDVDHLLGLGSALPEKYSAIHWVKKYCLPSIFVVIHSSKIENDIEKLSQLINYSPEIPLVWCSEDMDYKLAKQTMEMFYPYI